MLKKYPQTFTLIGLLIIFIFEVLYIRRNTDITFMEKKNPALVSQKQAEVAGSSIHDCSMDKTFVSVVLPYHCQETLSPAVGSVDITLNEDGSLVIMKGKETLITFLDSFTAPDTASFVINAKDFLNEETPQSKKTARPSSFIFEDINFDGAKDLIILSSSGAYNESFNYYLYDTKTKTFTKKPVLADAMNSSFDAVTKTINTFNKGRGLGDIYIAETYTFNGEGYSLSKEITQEFVDWKDEKKGYIYTEKELRNGKMVQTVQKKISQDEVTGE